ncbi:MAG: carbohydrate binding family 9 domain-containing protein [Lentimicrobium sp.]|nr:carbohydrate binding family 9 domain-containing protein [Lentimicrobium sp.]
MPVYRTKHQPKIDGIFDAYEWENATKLDGFRQYEPVSNANPAFETEVYIKYDDDAIYIAGIMTDPNPDSIARQLGVRDNENLNADYFGVGFDTYDNQQDAYYFLVSASGVQVDGRMQDVTYNAVWFSNVKIHENGWVAEFRIPYSALRFPKKEMQSWGFQAFRKVRRYREESQWSLEEKGAGNSQVYWGKITNLEQIKPPVRLSFTPYLSANFQHNSDKDFKTNPWTSTFNGGMDIKYGINESFTMDMILLPDFSQVKSDKVENNLTALELIYDENRTFFNEGTDLFQKGDLFYSRRIGRKPALFNNVRDSLQQNEWISNNPLNARLLNATKLSGRTAKGLGIGLFNGITGNTWATVKDSLSGNERQVLTDPFTNYNIVVLDQALPNNSSVYFINTNVSRPDGWDDSNVTGAGAVIGDKTKTYQLGASLSISKWFDAGEFSKKPMAETSLGYKYGLFFMKSRGKFQFSIYQSALDKYYNINDLGINRTRNQLNRGIYLSYRIYEPFSIFRNFSQSFGFDQLQSLDSKKNINQTFVYRGNTTFNNYFTLWWGLTASPFERHDFYEPRKAGRYYLMPGYTEGSFGFSSDYRKKFALDGNFTYNINYDKIKSIWMELEPIYRISDRLIIRHETEVGLNPGNLGYVNQNPIHIWFGRRDIFTLENAFSGDYMVNRHISIGVELRHFWQQGEYSEYFTLLNDGHLVVDQEYSGNHNFNYNFFSVDFNIGWEFAPGSLLSLVWKNNIEQYNNNYNILYRKNLEEMFNSPQLNIFSIKALYHLDYLQLKNLKRK